ncbi:MAG: hypothetical protein KC646_14000 [Candidatus Cloacimonetes bacterium]|nr:hypothetical protein [Candidatus Cloacimonadota bacterium]
MEELLLAAAICLLIGSSAFLYYYPIVTLLALAATFTVSIRWWQKKKLSLAHQENINKRIEKIKTHPEIDQVYIPNFEQTLQSHLTQLKKHLQDNEQDVILDLMQDLEITLQNGVYSNKDKVLAMLDDYVNTNHRVIHSEIKIAKEKINGISDEHSKSMQTEILDSLLEKQKLYQNNKQQIIHYYSQVKSILLQIDNLKLKSSKIAEGDQLVIDFKSDLSKTISQFDDANEVLDEIAKLNQ